MTLNMKQIWVQKVTVNEKVESVFRDLREEDRLLEIQKQNDYQRIL